MCRRFFSDTPEVINEIGKGTNCWALRIKLVSKVLLHKSLSLMWTGCVWNSKDNVVVLLSIRQTAEAHLVAIRKVSRTRRHLDSAQVSQS